MKPEFELLVRACGLARGLPVKGPAEQSEFPSGFDQALFVSMAIQHKVAGTAYSGLKKLGLGDSLVLEQSARLKQHAAQGQFIRAQIMEEAYAISSALAAQGIPALVIKGAASSIQFYGDPFVREYDDLDMLVNLPEIEPLVPILAQLGWTQIDKFLQKSSKYPKSKLIKRWHHGIFWNEEHNLRLEVHDRTGWQEESFHIDDIDTIFTRSVQLNNGQYKFVSLHPTDQALLALVHGTKHAWCLLHWLLDMAHILYTSSDEEVCAISSKVQALDMEAQLELAANVVTALCPIELPTAIASIVTHEKNIRKSTDFALKRLEVGGTDVASIRNSLVFFTCYSFPFLHGPKQKLRSAVSVVKILPQDAEALPLPRHLLFLHLFLRPFFSVSRHISSYIKRPKEKREDTNV
ncbi:MAG TPA: nucleotidyltransferase family protein [Rectinema sp.]|nr:nucleotidyltransferase family protein [Rectinema sp.]